MSETLNENIAYAKMFAQFPFTLRRFLKKRLTLDDAKRIVRERIARREENFLRMAERNIYGNASSPYLALLRHAGCELSDLRAAVKHNGIEKTLKQLRGEGVYVTFEEFKGRKLIVRNGLSLAVRASDFDNPFAHADLPKQTSGSSGAAVKVAINLDYIAARASNRLLALAAFGVHDAPLAIWRGIMPDRTMGQLLYGALTGQTPKRWFSPIGIRDSRHWVKYGLGSYYLIAVMRQAGVHIPWPESVPYDQAVRIAEWCVGAVKEYGRCLVRAGTSRPVHIAVAAQDAGLDLTGVTFVGGGEPATEGKTKQIERVGARFISSYGMSEVGQPAAGCANPVGVSDYHLWLDACALFSHPYRVESFGLDVPAFCLTTLLPEAPKVMLNVQTDDFGIVEERRCGCELESYGLTTHVREIRSYSKLTGEGVTLIGGEMIHILENVLPARFGGSPLDYQLMEQEDEQGLTRLYLLVNPDLPIENESALIACVLDSLRAASASADAARITWQNARTLQIKRSHPVFGATGKFAPLYLPQRYNEKNFIPTGEER